MNNQNNDEPVIIPRKYCSSFSNDDKQKYNYKNIKIEDGTQYISWEKFMGLNVENVYFPSSLNEIWQKVFYDCKIKSIVIPNHITYIGEGAFSHCFKLSSITLPTALTYIHKSLFSTCLKLNEITIPDSVIEIKDSAFADCSSLSSIKFSDNVEKISFHCFDSCTSLTSIVLPSKLKDIGSKAFNNCINLTSIIIPNSVSCLPVDTFSNCSNLRSITIPKHIDFSELDLPVNCKIFLNHSVGECLYSTFDSCFGGCDNTTTQITIQKIECEQSYYDKEIPKHFNVEHVKIEDGTKFLGAEMFLNCKHLRTIEIPNSVSDIGFRTFYNCRNLQTITIPNSVSEIRTEVFKGCQSLTSIKLPSNLKSIDLSAFCSCENLKILDFSDVNCEELLISDTLENDNLKLLVNNCSILKQKFPNNIIIDSCVDKN